MTLEGIDVSYAQRTTPSLDGLAFAFAKASEGLRGDPMYRTHAAHVRGVSIVLGAYHFARRDAPVIAQANTFLSLARGADLLALDVEGPFAFTPAQAKQFFGVIHLAKRKCGLYHSESGFFEAGQDFDWVANWSHEPRRHWDFWQYGPRPGTHIDGDHYAGSAADLAKLTGKTPAPPPADRNGTPVLPTDDITAMHAAGYWMSGGRWVKGTVDRTGTPVQPGDDIDAMHAAGYWMSGGKWVKG
jgi:hypothetical protein